MTISTTTNRWAYTGNGSTTAFAYTNRIFATSDLKVYLDGVLQSSGYTVSGVGSGSGGNVTFSVAPASAVVVTIVRDVPYTQAVSIPEGDPFPSDTVEAMADKVTVLVQQLLAERLRSLRLPLGEATAGLDELPALATRAGKFLSFDGSGQPAAAALAVTGNPASAVGSTLMQALTYAAMRALLDLEPGVDVQAYNANLAALSGLTLADDTLPYATGAGALALADLTSFARTLLDDASAAAAVATLGNVPELLNTTIVSGTPTALTWEDAAWFDGTYRVLEVWLSNLALTNDNDGIDAFMRAASTYLTSAYNGAIANLVDGSGPAESTATTARMLITAATSMGNDTGEAYSGRLRFILPGAAGVQKSMFFEGEYGNTSGVRALDWGSYRNAGTAALDGIKVQVATVASNTFVNGGVAQLWGYR